MKQAQNAEDYSNHFVTEVAKVLTISNNTSQLVTESLGIVKTQTESVYGIAKKGDALHHVINNMAIE